MDVFFISYKTDFTNSEWNQMVKEAFGKTLVKHSEDAPTTILGVVQNTIQDRIREIKEREYAFGCHLSNISNFEPLSIGSVCFEPRLAWLDRVRSWDGVSKTSKSRIERAWEGKYLRRRKPSWDESNEFHVLDTVGKSAYVCSVSIGPMGEEAGLQKALLAARVATTAIALAWARPSTALNVITLTFDRQPLRQTNLVSSQPGHFGWSSSLSYVPGGVTWLSADDWQTLRTDFSNLFECAGEAVRFVTHGENEVARPNIAAVLYQALLWFHEGCREDVDPMAIVKFCSSMEALACGKQDKGILDLINARLRVRDVDKLREHLQGLYRTGRSRTVHGTNDRLGHDWSESRVLAENLARHSIIGCLEWASENPQSDDPACFLQS